MQRWMIVLCLALAAGFIKAKLRHHDLNSTAASTPVTDTGAVRTQMQGEINDMKRRLPIQISPHVRIQQVAFVNDVAVMVAVQDGVFEPTDDAKAAFTKAVKDDYCHGSMKRAADAKISIEVDLKTPSRTLEDPFGKTWVATFAPQQCV